MKIEQLLEPYFEGLTSAEEEAKLRRFFMSDDVPDNLMMYKPLFVYFDSEITKSHPKSSYARTTIILWLSGAAACTAILIGSFFITTQQNRCPEKGNYVMIDGRCHTDAATIRKTMQMTLQEVSDGNEFPSDAKPVYVIDMVENQLKEFDFLFDE